MKKKIMDAVKNDRFLCLVYYDAVLKVLITFCIPAFFHFVCLFYMEERWRQHIILA